MTREEFIAQRFQDLIDAGRMPPTLEQFKEDVVWTGILSGKKIEIDVEAEYNAIWDSEYELYRNKHD